MKSTKYIWLIVGIVVCLISSTTTAQQEQWLQYRSEREISLLGIGTNWQSLELKSVKPLAAALPKYIDSEPLFVEWKSPMVKIGFLWISLDRKHKNGLYDLLYIDSNGNGNLNDEEPIEAYRTDQYSTYFGPAKVIFQIEDGPVAYHLNFRYYSSSNYKRLYVSSGGWYEGEITVGDEKKHCTLFDYNANGTFNDKSSSSAGSDRIRIGSKNSQDTRYVGNFIDVDGTLYSPEIAKDGAFIKIKKAENVELGKIKLQKSITEFSAGGENGLFNYKPENGVITLPVGNYRINYWSSERKDERGTSWKLQASGSGSKGVFDVKKDTQIVLSIGEPVYATLEARKGESQYSFQHNLEGRDGERIELTRNGARPQAPKVHIRSKDNEYDRTFSFSYG